MPYRIVAASAAERVLARLKGVKQTGKQQWAALCPAHDDQQQSLSIRVGSDDRALMHCHAGCQTKDIVAAVGLTMNDLFSAKQDAESKQVNGPSLATPKAQGVEQRAKLVKTYDYVKADGSLAFQACRFEPKTFRQRRKGADGAWSWSIEGVELVPYRLPEIVEAVSMGRRVFVVEGEKDADVLAEMGYPATTNPMGAGKWRDAFSKHLNGADVVILPDNDEPGRMHAEHVATSLYAENCTVKIVELPGVPEKGDVSDWLAAGGDLDELETLISLAPRWMPDESKRTRWWLDEVWERPALMQPPPPVVPYLAWGARSTLLAAREKSGKSTLTGYIAAQVSRGGEFLNEPCHQGTVLILGLEEFIGDTARRLKQFGADGRRVALVDRFAGDVSDRPSEVRAHIEAVNPILVILDSLVAYSRGVVTDANNAIQTQAVVQGLTDLCHQTAVALILIHHARKADGKYRDSSAIGGAVDIIAEVFPPEEFQNTDPNRRRVRPIGRVPARPVDFRYDGHSYSIVDPSMSDKAPLDQRIQAVVGERPGISGNDVVQAVGDRRELVLSRLGNMIATGLIVNDGDMRHMKLRLPAFSTARSLIS